MKKYFNYTVILVILIATNINAQPVYEPVKNNVYDFLDRMANLGYVKLNDEVKPFTRKQIADYLLEIKNEQNKINKVEKETLSWYFQEYRYEIADTTTPKRLHLYSFENKIFQFKVSPIVGYGIRLYGDKKGFDRTIGARVFFTYGNWFGGSFHARDNGEFGDDVDLNKIFSPLRGYDPISVKNGIEHSDVRAQINFAWKWGELSLRKDYMQWGNGYFGQLILSDKAPSYPHLFFKIKPISWFRFYYVYGMLHSGVIDSNSIIVTNSSDIAAYNFESFVPKHFVANLLTISPWRFMDFSLGNFAVYAGDFRPEMAIPFNFFKYMDRDTGKKSIQDVNGGMYFNIQIRYPQKFKFYSTLFIDVTSIRGILKNDLHETWAGYSFGMRSSSFLLENIDFIIEYTRLNPWLYEHKYGGLTNYKHLSYPLGHWIGQNADQLKIKFIYYPLRGMNIALSLERLRKGGLKDIYYAYGGASASTMQPFLYGPLRKDFDISLKFEYEIVYDLFLRAGFTYSNISDEDTQRTPQFLLGAKNSYYLSLYYGL